MEVYGSAEVSLMCKEKKESQMRDPACLVSVGI